MKFKYNDGGRSKYFTNKEDDSVCRSIAIATGRDYREIYNLINKYIESENLDELYISNAKSNISKDICYKLLKSLGWKWNPCMFFGKGYTIHLKNGELPKKGTLIVSISNQLTCVKNNVIYDVKNPDRNGTRCVYGYWSKS